MSKSLYKTTAKYKIQTKQSEIMSNSLLKIVNLNQNGCFLQDIFVWQNVK